MRDHLTEAAKQIEESGQSGHQVTFFAFVALIISDGRRLPESGDVLLRFLLEMVCQIRRWAVQLSNMKVG